MTDRDDFYPRRDDSYNRYNRRNDIDFTRDSNRSDDDGYYDEDRLDSDLVRRQESSRYRDEDRDGYRAGYRDGYRDSDYGRREPSLPRQSGTYNMTGKTRNFARRHPVLMNLLLAIFAGIVLIYIALWFLDFWTFHGEERAVPDVKGQSLSTAQSNIANAGLVAVVSDSIYESFARPGTVVEQTPIPNAKVKKDGSVYLTIVAFTPKMVSIPDFYDVSERQARSMLNGLGITQIRVDYVMSEFDGLVLGARFNGVTLRPGAKVPVSAVITLEVGSNTGMGSTDMEQVTDTAAIDNVIETLDLE